MTGLTHQVRKWLASLNESELGIVLTVCDRLRAAAKLPQVPKRASATPRDQAACRIWSQKASGQKLELVVTSALPAIANLLIDHHGWPSEQVEEPDLEQLTEMLTMLGRPIGQLALYALLLTDQPASRLAREHHGRLEKALQATGLKRAPEPNEKHNGPPPAGQTSIDETDEAAETSDEKADFGSARLDAAALDHMAESLSRLQELAASLAELLRTTAIEVEAGRRVTSGLNPLLTSYDQRHESLVAEMTEYDPKCVTASFETIENQLATWRTDLADRERKWRQGVADQIADLERTISEIDAMIANNPVPALSDARAQYQQRLQDLQKSIAEDATASAAVGADSEEPNVRSNHSSATNEEDSLVAEHEEAPENPHAAATSHVPAADAVAAPQPQPEPEPAANAEAAEAEEKTGSAEDSPLDSPWEEGTPPVAVALVESGRLAEAYWVTAMSAEPDRRSAVLSFAASAYSAYNSEDATAVLGTLTLDAQELSRDADAAVLATTGLLRAGLVAGWGPQMLPQLEPALSVLPDPWQDLLKTAIRATRLQYRIEPAVGVRSTADTDEIRAELGRRAESLAADLPLRKNLYQRGTRVLQRLAREGQPLDNGLQAVIAWSNGTGSSEQLASAVEKFTGQNAADELIDEADAAVRTPKQTREPIIAGARRGLQRAVEEVATLVREAHAVSVRINSSGSADKAIGAALGRAVTALQDQPAPPGMAGSAVKLLRDWMAEPSSVLASPIRQMAPAGENSAAEPTTDVLLPLTDLAWTDDGRPDQDHPDTSAVLARLVQPFDITAAVMAYCERGDLRKASRILELQEHGCWEAEADNARLQQTISNARHDWAARHRKAVSEARDLFARVRAQNLLNQSDDSAVSGRIEALTTVSDDDYHAASRQLADLIGELTNRQRARIEELGTQLDTLQMSDADRRRIRGLLDEADTVTATEFLSFAMEGKPLPEHFDPGTEDVSLFTQFLEEGFRNKLDAPHTSAHRWAALAEPDTPLTNHASNGIDAWDLLADPTGRGRDNPADNVRRILYTLGLNCSERPNLLSPRARRGFRTYRAKATPNDGSYISDLGSSANEYTVTVVLDERRGRSVLSVLDPEDTSRTNIVVYPHAMDLAARQALAAHAVNSKVKALVIDPAAFGWVAAKTPNSWRATQRITLPWTIFEPYKPFVAGLVPPEVFVGRATEMSQVTDPEGGLFVYGGRQLGKSALLRRVHATFDNSDTKHAIYLDLKAKGIGEAEPASRIWRALTIELKNRGVLGPKVSDEAPPDTVINNVKAWLSENPSRRVLMLADEADAFLTADSRGESTPGGVSHFRNVLGLKELMESTERRFKVVFAGLHQVQRFGHISNVPLVHGGPDILIGPLEPLDARKLVVEPMAALGYRFERPELVWRLLSATNYQASLIQIFCEELVRMLHGRRGRSQSVPVLVTEDDVEAVAASDWVRSRIAERLRITINLDDRYRVLTLVIALFSLNDSFGTDYGPEELLDEARNRWHSGFAELTASQVSIYLDEMVGLGLLSRLPHKKRYTVRSPNVINMLGTKADLERELAETDFDRPYEYNPREARRLLACDDGGREFHSPLTDGQLHDLTFNSGISVITGSPALGIDRVPSAIQNYAEMRGTRTATVSSDKDLKKVVTEAVRRRSSSTIVIVDALRMPLPEVDSVTGWVEDRLAKKTSPQNVSAVILAAPAVASVVAAKVGIELIRLERWTARSVRSWPECPFDVPEAREKLIKATGGWPDLVERTISWVINGGSTLTSAVHRAEQKLSEPQTCRAHLTACALDESLIHQIENWVEYFEPGDVVPPEDVEAALETDRESSRALLQHLSMLNVLDEYETGVALDLVVHRCLQSLRGAS
ncbi:hypothetical protein ABT337_15260 [Saccharopolyspora hirsuta]|uniref:Uncharacterized protein n=1 Tax=Saccharopolyspora hirsuta TaxID=1837 RepID=A0A5M7CAL6_SACHI|nr:hypothetical protein [Saccharopolyspora hirsuta]KAA5837248.1 hypothetical protein F1721_05485 [Saccharopolyspora hirsuta]